LGLGVVFVPYSSFPGVKNGDGKGLLLRLAFPAVGSIDMSFVSSDHTVNEGIRFIKGGSNADFSSLNMDSKFYIMKKSKLYPYFLGGVSSVDVTANDAMNIYYDLKGDMTLIGFGFKVGGGLEYHVNTRIVFFTDVIMNFLSMSGTMIGPLTYLSKEQEEIAKKFSGTSTYVTTGLLFIF